MSCFERAIFIEESGGRPVSAAHVVGYFDSIDQMHAVYNRYQGHTALSVDGSGWRLVK